MIRGRRDARTRPTVRVIGSGTSEQSLREHAASLGIEDLVTFHTDVANNGQVSSSLMKSAKAFVLPSEREGFGIVALDAMACGLPVVTTAAPDNLARHLVDHVPTGSVCAPTSADLAEGVLNAVDKRGSTAVDGVGRIDLTTWSAPYTWPMIAEIVGSVMDRDASDDRRTRDRAGS